MLLYSNYLSTIAKTYLLTMSELFPTCFSCIKNVYRSHSSLGFSCKNFVEIPEAMIAGDLSIFISVLSRVDFLPGALTTKYISFAKSYIKFLSD